MTRRLDISQTAHLRPFEESDAAELHATIESNRARLALWLPWAAEQTFDDTVGFIRRTLEQRANDDGFQAAIVCDGAIAGAAGYRGIDWQDCSTSLGYWLGEEHEGRGTMTAAVRTLADHAFSSWGLSRVEIRAAPGNRRSRAVPERLGFREEKTLAEADLVGGRYLDSVVYAMQADEWPKVSA